MAYFKYQGKSVYYTEYGQGEPLVFLHGNTASSKMSGLLMPLYADKFRCILIDFLGNGQSNKRRSMCYFFTHTPYNKPMRKFK